ncbi:hypothetical protein NDU88_003468 [Pleurodeles waltl]|uniref:Uncharacterized protein n=1 Tax=Pleurodeles waltl TaxID=8319 RepID=A0AAV7W3M1_PLEWA|nr:hypothetical protein NDU88_003468 [Pleurodeles waltl]
MGPCGSSPSTEQVPQVANSGAPTDQERPNPGLLAGLLNPHPRCHTGRPHSHRTPAAPPRPPKHRGRAGGTSPQTRYGPALPREPAARSSCRPGRERAGSPSTGRAGRVGHPKTPGPRLQGRDKSRKGPPPASLTRSALSKEADMHCRGPCAPCAHSARPSRPSRPARPPAPDWCSAATSSLSTPSKVTPSKSEEASGCSEGAFCQIGPLPAEPHGVAAILRDSQATPPFFSKLQEGRDCVNVVKDLVPESEFVYEEDLLPCFSSSPACLGKFGADPLKWLVSLLG